MELWKIIHSEVESWEELRMDTPDSSLHRAVRLLHQTDSGKFWFWFWYQLTKSSTDKVN